MFELTLLSNRYQIDLTSDPERRNVLPMTNTMMNPDDFDADFGDFAEDTFDPDFDADEMLAAELEAEMIFDQYDYEPSPYFGDYSEM